MSDLVVLTDPIRVSTYYFRHPTPAEITAAFLALWRCTTCGGTGKVPWVTIGATDGWQLCPDCVDGWKLDELRGLIFDAIADGPSGNYPYEMVKPIIDDCLSGFVKWLAAMEAE